MKHTDRQPATKTLADLYRAIDRRHAVTITYLKPGETEPTVRTIEIAEIRTTTDGGIVLIAMCRLRNAERQFHLEGVQTYTLHRIAYVLTRPEPTTYERPAPADDAQALYFYELARDKDDADYRPRKRLGLAA
ncbi:WYL domain-containing protein [Streptomyces sp. NPDC058297]|uniref:WYL domain-containing protein n=1 Tax=Streptomyces sp. NPDC058297 TaxID=3346433 RepID=UPI0036EDCE94